MTPMTNGTKLVTGVVVVAAVVGLGFLVASAPAPTISETPSTQQPTTDCPAATGYVQDCANVIPDDQQAQLEARLSTYDTETTNQIAVVTVNSLGGKDIEGYSIKLAEALKVGRADIDNGVILVVAVKDRKMRIEVGHGNEGDLTDSEAGDIIRDVITPEFKAGNIPDGISVGVEAIIKQLPNNK